MGWFNKDNRKKYALDTSILIDGRLMVMYRNELLDGRIIVPSFVLRELQQLADSTNVVSEKKGKKGLSALNDLKAALGRVGAGIEIHGREFPEVKEVDDKLLSLCEEEQAVLVTVDSNLTQVAKLKDLKVLSPNVLVNQLRRAISQGDRYSLRLSEAGRQAGQATGYLSDGTMVVVADGLKYMGRVVPVVVRNVLITDSGLIAFAEIRW